jgi:hypothetical protein
MEWYIAAKPANTHWAPLSWCIHYFLCAAAAFFAVAGFFDAGFLAAAFLPAFFGAAFFTDFFTDFLAAFLAAFFGAAFFAAAFFALGAAFFAAALCATLREPAFFAAAFLIAADGVAIVEVVMGGESGGGGEIKEAKAEKLCVRWREGEQRVLLRSLCGDFKRRVGWATKAGKKRRANEEGR